MKRTGIVTAALLALAVGEGGAEKMRCPDGSMPIVLDPGSPGRMVSVKHQGYVRNAKRGDLVFYTTYTGATASILKGVADRAAQDGLVSTQHQTHVGIFVDDGIHVRHNYFESELLDYLIEGKKENGGPRTMAGVVIKFVADLAKLIARLPGTSSYYGLIELDPVQVAAGKPGLHTVALADDYWIIRKDGVLDGDYYQYDVPDGFAWPRSTLEIMKPKKKPPSIGGDFYPEANLIADQVEGLTLFYSLHGFQNWQAALNQGGAVCSGTIARGTFLALAPTPWAHLSFQIPTYPKDYAEAGARGLHRYVFDRVRGEVAAQSSSYLSSNKMDAMADAVADQITGCVVAGPTSNNGQLVCGLRPSWEASIAAAPSIAPSDLVTQSLADKTIYLGLNGATVRADVAETFYTERLEGFVPAKWGCRNSSNWGYDEWGTGTGTGSGGGTGGGLQDPIEWTHDGMLREAGPCGHDVSVVGQPLPASCSPCAKAVCSFLDTQSCCVPFPMGGTPYGWTQQCVERAARLCGAESLDWIEDKVGFVHDVLGDVDRSVTDAYPGWQSDAEGGGTGVE